MSTLTGIRPMLALTIRRERLHAPAWYGLVGVLLVLLGAGTVATYPTEASRLELAGSVSRSVGELFLIGPVMSTDVGGIVLWRTLGNAAIFTSLASIFTVVRNTRAAEEDGAYELLGSAPVGRAAPLATALGVAAAGSVLTGLLAGAGLFVLGAATPGSILMGAQVVCFGLLAASVAGLIGQLVRTGRAATGASVAVVVVCYLLRGIADATHGSAADWVSPFSWIVAVRPFTDADLWMLLPAPLLAALLGAGALAVAARRDLGAGLLPDRAGPAYAHAALRGPLSLALRVSRATIFGWVAGATVVGLLIGAVASTVNKQIGLELGGATGGGAGLVQVALYLSPLAAAVLGIQTTLRLRGEVTSGRAEAVLSRPVHRGRWLLAHAITGALASLSVLLGFGLGLGLAGASSRPGAIVSLSVAATVRAPAAWVFVALASLLVATVPRAATAMTFAVLGAFLLLELTVEFHLAPPRALYASPFALVPQLPAGPGHLGPVLFLLAITLGLTTLGTRLLLGRDIR